MAYYKQYTKELLPAYFLEPDSVGYFDVSGSMKDDVNSAAQDAVQDSFIQSAPNDALNNIGSNFNIQRPGVFSDDQYRTKLEGNWDYWATSGTPNRLITEVESYGFQNVSILPEWVESPPGTWTKSLPIRDPLPEMDLPNDNSFGGGMGIGWWSNFWVVIPLPHSFSSILWGTPESGNWGTGGTYGPYLWGGVSGDQALLKDLVALIKKLKPAWSCCRGIIFGLTGFTTWGSFLWADGTVWGTPMGSYVVHYIREDWET